MARKKSRAVADAEELERVAAEWKERVRPENTAKLREEMLRKASPEQRKRFDELAALAKEPRVDARTEFVRAFGKVDTDEKRNALNRLLWEFAGQVADGQVDEVVRFLWEARKKGPKSGGKESGDSRKRDADTWHSQCVEKARELLEQGRSQHELAGILAKHFHKTATTIRAILKKAQVK